VIHYVLPSVAFEPNVPLVIMTVLLEPYWVMAGAALQIQERAGYLAIWSTVRIIAAGAIRVWFVAGLLAGVSGFITANLLTAALFAVVAAVILRTEVTLAFNPGVIRQALALGSPTIPNNLLSYGFRLVDRFFLERFASLEQIGLYYVALRVADVMRLCADTLINAWRPIFFKEGHNESFVRFDAPRVIRLAMVAIASLFVALSVFAREAMGLLAAPEYAAASALVPVLVGAMALKSVQSFPYLVIWYRKRTSWVPFLTAATLGVGLAGNWLFVPRWGAMGAATALVLSYASLTVIMFAVARRLHALNYPWRELTITAALGLATVLLAAQLNEGVLPLLWKLVLMACYGTALVATRCLPTDDLRALRSGAALVSIEGKA
jgi:O-antigen/teichoic acid export membrane protein